MSKDNRDSVTTSYGVPLGEKNACLTVGPRGPILLEDVVFLDDMAHFARERVPERVVHAKGAGAFGYFEVTNDITKYCAARVFEEIGKRTRIAIRFSTVSGELGSADTVRDIRGFAVKFYTDEGIWDLVGNNTPIFFIRDPILFPNLVHASKKNPATNVPDPNMFWDFATLRPETVHQIMIVNGDRGIPDGFRHMNGYGGHAFKLINADGDAVYCKFHYLSDQGVKTLTSEKAVKLAGKCPDYGVKDLYDAIAKGKFPSWSFSIQVMTMEEAEQCAFNPFDLTKVWSHKQYPLIPVGKLILNQNPTNYFAEVEQIAFNPAHMVPGIQPSPDRMLAGRLFAYGDTHRYRIGVNYLQLPVNCPHNVRNYQRDGHLAHDNQGSCPNYYPNSFCGPEVNERAKTLSPPFQLSGDVSRYDVGDDDNYTQAGDLYRNVFAEDAKQRLVNNIVSDVKNVTPVIQQRVVEMFTKVDSNLGQRIAAGLKIGTSSVQQPPRPGSSGRPPRSTSCSGGPQGCKSRRTM